MEIAPIAWTGLALACAGCATTSAPVPPPGAPLATAERILDAFYAFDGPALRRAMADAPGSQPQIVYYQGWAEGGHYRVLDRKPCRVATAEEIRCDITVRDDLVAALGTGYDVTDTFVMSFSSGKIVAVDTTSNDPPEFDQAFAWVEENRPETFTGPCTGFFRGGPTPQQCVEAIVAGFRAWRAQR